MTIEVRQLLVKASVGEAQGAGPDEPAVARGPDWQELKDELLAECREWLLRQLQDARER
jgi:hypothetical protein